MGYKNAHNGYIWNAKLFKTRDIVLLKINEKNRQKLKKSVDIWFAEWYSNKADAAEGAGGTLRKSVRCTLKIKHCKNTKHYVL